MTNRYVSVLPNNDLVTRGNSGFMGNRVNFIQHADELLKYTIDLKRFMASGETVSSSTADASGVTVGSKTNNSDNITFTISGVSGYGTVDLLVTTSEGQKKMIYLSFTRPQPYEDTDYYPC